MAEPEEQTPEALSKYEKPQRVFRNAQEARAAGYQVTEGDFAKLTQGEGVRRRAQEALEYSNRYRLGDTTWLDEWSNVRRINKEQQKRVAQERQTQATGQRENLAVYREDIADDRGALDRQVQIASGQATEAVSDYGGMARDVVRLAAMAERTEDAETKAQLEQLVDFNVRQAGVNLSPHLYSVDPKYAEKFQQAMEEGFEPQGIKEKLKWGAGQFLTKTGLAWAGEQLEKPQEMMMGAAGEVFRGKSYEELDRDSDGNVSLSELFGKEAPQGSDDWDSERVKRGMFRLADGVWELVIDPVNLVTLGAGSAGKGALNVAQEGAKALNMAEDGIRLTQQVQRYGRKSLSATDDALLQQFAEEGAKVAKLAPEKYLEILSGPSVRTGPGILGQTIVPTGRLGDVGRKAGVLRDVQFDDAGRIINQQKGLKDLWLTGSAWGKARVGQGFLNRYRVAAEFGSRQADELGSAMSRTREIQDFRSNMMALTDHPLASKSPGSDSLRVRGEKAFSDLAQGDPRVADDMFRQAISGEMAQEMFEQLPTEARELVDTTRRVTQQTKTLAHNAGYSDFALDGISNKAPSAKVNKIYKDIKEAEDIFDARIAELSESGTATAGEIARLEAGKASRVAGLQEQLPSQQLLDVPIARNYELDYKTIVERDLNNVFTAKEIRKVVDWLRDTPTSRIAASVDNGMPKFLAEEGVEQITNAAELNNLMRRHGLTEDLFIENAADAAMAESHYIAGRVGDVKLLTELATTPLPEGFRAVYGGRARTMDEAGVGVLRGEEVNPESLAYKALEKDAKASGKTLDEVKGLYKLDVTPDGSHWLIRKEYYEELDLARRVIQGDPKAVNLFTNLNDAMNTFWASMATSAGINPAFMARNVQSNTMFQFLAGVRNPMKMVEAGSIQRKMIQARLTASRTGADYEKLLADALGDRWDDIKAALDTGVLDSNYATDVLKGRDKLAATTGKSKPRKFVEEKIVGPDAALVQPGKAVSSTFENNGRLAVFLDQVDKGNTYNGAADHVKKYMFDYGDLTRFEREGVRNFARFWTFTRNNMRLWAREAVTHPVQVKKVMETVSGVQGAITGQEGDERGLLPDWMPTAAYNPVSGVYASVDNPASAALDIWMTPTKLLDAATTNTGTLGVTNSSALVMALMDSLSIFKGSAATATTDWIYSQTSGVDTFTQREIERGISGDLKDDPWYQLVASLVPIVGRTTRQGQAIAELSEGEISTAQFVLSQVLGIRTGEYALEDLEDWERRDIEQNLSESLTQLAKIDKNVPTYEELMDAREIQPKDRLASVLIGGVKGVRPNGEIIWRSDSRIPRTPEEKEACENGEIECNDEDLERFLNLFDDKARQELGLPDPGAGSKRESKMLPEDATEQEKLDLSASDMARAWEYLTGEPMSDELKKAIAKAQLSNEVLERNAIEGNYGNRYLGTDEDDPEERAKAAQQQLEATFRAWGVSTDSVQQTFPLLDEASRIASEALQAGISYEDMIAYVEGEELSRTTLGRLNYLVTGDPNVGPHRLEFTREYENFTEEEIVRLNRETDNTMSLLRMIAQGKGYTLSDQQLEAMVLQRAKPQEKDYLGVPTIKGPASREDITPPGVVISRAEEQRRAAQEALNQ